MNLVLVAIVIFAFAQEPSKPPEGKWAAKSKVAQDTQQTHASDEKKSHSDTMFSPLQQIAAQKPQGDTSESSEDVKIQRRIETFTGLLVIVGFLQAGMMFLQWCIYRRQARIMAHQTGEMTRQRVTMHRQLEAMTGQLVQMESAGAQTNQLIEQARRQAEHLAIAAEAAKDSAGNALRAVEIAEKSAIQNVEQMRLEQRAWVAASMVMIGDVAIGKPVSASIRLQNIGKSLALSVRSYQVLEFSEGPLTRFSMMGGSDPDIILFPGADFWIKAASADPIVSEDHMRAIQAGKQLIYAYGMIQYHDIFTEDWHTTRFSFVSEDGRGFKQCQGNNEAD